MKTIITVFLAALVSGCSTARYSVGHSMASAGSKTGKTGTAILAASGICPLFIPIGVAVWIPTSITAAALYYPGCLIAGDEIESGLLEM